MPLKGYPKAPRPSYRGCSARDVVAEIDLCVNTFGAVERVHRPGPDQRAAHAMLTIGPAMIMIEAEWPALPSRPPTPDGSSPVVIYVYVEDVDKTVERAIIGGAKVLFPNRISSGATASVGSWIPPDTYGPSPRVSRRLRKRRGGRVCPE